MEHFTPLGKAAARALSRAYQKHATPKELADRAEQARDDYMKNPTDINAADYVAAADMADIAVIKNARK